MTTATDILRKAAVAAYLADMVSRDPADIMAQYLATGGKAVYTGHKMDADTRLYCVADDCTAAISWNAVDSAYWECNKTFLSAANWVAVADVIRYNAQYTMLKDKDGNIPANITLNPMHPAAKTALEKLAANDERWTQTTRSALAFQMEEFRKILLPADTEPPAYFRNADRTHFALALCALNKDGKHNDFFKAGAERGAKFMQVYFRFLEYARTAHVYDTNGGGVTAPATPAPADK